MIALTQALQGLSNAEAQFDIAARQMGQAPLADLGQGDQVDLSTAAVALLQARDSFETNLKVMHTADQMEKKLLDMVG